MSAPVMQRPGGLALTARALLLCGFAPGAQLLDIGCGRGATVAYLASRGFTALGIDHDSETVRSVREQSPTCGVEQGDARALSVDSQSMDGVFFECSLSVTGDTEKSLSEAARVLRPGGWLVVSDLYGRAGSAHLNGVLGDIRTEEQLRRAVTEAGFGVETFEDYSRALSDYAAERLWQGDTLCDFSADETALLRQIRCGYCLILARRDGVSGASFSC